MAILESVATSSRRTKENVRIDSLIPMQLRQDSELLLSMLDSYYEFMNLFAYYYKVKDQHFYATVVDGKMIFKAETNNYFYDTTFTETHLYAPNGDEITLPNVGTFISGTDNLPAALADDLTTYGTLFNFGNDVFDQYENQQLHLVTPIVVYVGDCPTYTINTVLEQRDIDRIRLVYLEQLQKEIAVTIPRNLQSDKKLLYKNITQFYRERGSEQSVRIFFELLLNDVVEIKYPAKDMLIPSDGNWDLNSTSYEDEVDDGGNIIGKYELQGKYLDNGGFLSDHKKIQDSFFYQRFAYVIRTGSNLDLWGNAFNKLIHPAGFKFFGEVVLFIYLNQRNSIMPFNQPGLIGEEDVKLIFTFFADLLDANYKVNLYKSAKLGTIKMLDGVITQVEITDRGYGYTTPPVITITDGDGVDVAFSLEIDSNGSIKTTDYTEDKVPYVVPTNGGSGYILPSGVITPLATDGQVANVQISKMSRTYKGTPSITFTSPIDETGLPAQGTPILDSKNRIVGINITDPGSRYVVPPRMIIDGVIEQLAETVYKLIIESKHEYNWYDYLNDRWNSLLKFYDNTPMYRYFDYTIDNLDKQVEKVYANVGTEIFGLASIPPTVTFTDIENKLQSKL
jgi:hypothetical protein